MPAKSFRGMHYLSIKLGRCSRILELDVVVNSDSVGKRRLRPCQVHMPALSALRNDAERRRVK